MLISFSVCVPPKKSDQNSSMILPPFSHYTTEYLSKEKAISCKIVMKYSRKDNKTPLIFS